MSARPASEYVCNELPDPRSPHCAYATEGDLQRAVSEAAGAWLRSLAHARSDGAWGRMRLLYCPDREPTGRLTLDFATYSPLEDEHAALDLLLTRGGLGVHYAFHPGPPQVEEDPGMCHAAYVTRWEGVVPAGTDPSENYAASAAGYYMTRPMAPARMQSFVPLDNLLSGLGQPAVIEMVCGPARPARITRAFHEHLRRLEQAARPGLVDQDAALDAPQTVHGEDFDTGLHRARVPRPVPDRVADTVERACRELADSLLGPCLRFAVRARSVSPATARLVAGVLAASVLEEGSYAVHVPEAQGEPATLNSLASGVEAVPFSTLDSLYPSGPPKRTGELRGLAWVASPGELTPLFTPPVAGRVPARTIRKSSDPPAADILPLGRDWFPEPGTGGGAVSPQRGVAWDALCRHTAIFGMPGMGKTSTVLGIIAECLRRDIPVLVLECRKREYRDLLRLGGLGKPVRVFSPGDPLSPYRHNPLIFPGGIEPDTWVSAVLQVLRASMPMAGPMLPLLTESLHALYRDFWKRTVPPVFEDFQETFETVLAAKQYHPQVVADISAMGSARFVPAMLGHLGHSRRTATNIPCLDPVPDGCTVIELEALSREQACLEAMSILQHVRHVAGRTPHRGELPRLLVVIEEAHVVMPAGAGPAQASEYAPSSEAFMADLAAQLLAEFRALGVALVVCDQQPTAVTPALLKNAGTLVAFRQRDGEEVERIARALLLDELSVLEMGRFVCGDAFLISDGYTSARHIRMRDTKRELDLGSPMDDRELHGLLAAAQWFRDAHAERLTGDALLAAYRLDQFRALLKETDSVITGRAAAPGAGDWFTASQGRLRKAMGRLSTFLDALRETGTIIEPCDDLSGVLAHIYETDWPKMQRACESMLASLSRMACECGEGHPG